LAIFLKDQQDSLAGKTPLIKELIKKSSFKSINRSSRCLNKFPDEKLKLIFIESVADYLDNLEPGTISFESNSEKIAFLSILDRLERLEKKMIEGIVKSINEEEFLEEKDFIGSLQLLLYILTVYDVDPVWREEMLTLANSDKILNKLALETSLNAFLYLWNTYALFKREGLSYFRQWIDPKIVNKIFKVIKKCSRAGGNVEGVRHLLMLIGLLNYLGIEPERLKNIFSGGFQVLNLSKSFLAAVLRKSNFLPGFFYLKGIEFFVKKPLFPNKWKLLTPTVYNVKARTKVLRKLVEAFYKKIRKKA
jgi:hypothetical protein